MHVHDAIERLDQIHDQLTRSEVYRGLRVPAVALVGAIAVLAAAVQPCLAEAREGSGFVYYWIAVAAVCGLLGMATGIRAYVFREDEFARRRTRRVLFQFLPFLGGGAAVTAGFLRGGPELMAFLPGLWAMIFGFGVIAASPYLPSSVRFIGLGYVVCGAVLLLRAPVAAEPAGWAMGGIFGAGHFATAFALWLGEGNDDV